MYFSNTLTAISCRDTKSVVTSLPLSDALMVTRLDVNDLTDVFDDVLWLGGVADFAKAYVTNRDKPR